MNDPSTFNVWSRAEEETGEVVIETNDDEIEPEEGAGEDQLATEQAEVSAPESAGAAELEALTNVVPLRAGDEATAPERVDEPDQEPQTPPAASAEQGLYAQYEEPEAPQSFGMPEDELEHAEPVDEVRRLDVRKLGALTAVFIVLVAAGVALAASQTTQPDEPSEAKSTTNKTPGAKELEERDREAEGIVGPTEEDVYEAAPAEEMQAPYAQPVGVPPGYESPEEREARQRLTAERAERAKARGSQIAFRRRTPPSERAAYTNEGVSSGPAMQGIGPAHLTFQSREEAPQQDPKLAFFNDQRARPTKSPHAVQAPGSPYVVMEGSVLDMVLETAIDSQNPGLVKARLVRAVFDTPTGQHLLVPAGTIVLGEYNSQTRPGQTRAQIAWRRMILPGGDSIQIPGAVGIAADGSSGIEGDVDRHLDEVAIAALVSTTLTAGAASVSNTPANQSGPSEWAAQGAGQAVSDVGERLVDEASQIPPTIRIEPGTRVMAFVRSDLVFDRPR